jgi:hypothetical protein
MRSPAVCFKDENSPHQGELQGVYMKSIAKSRTRLSAGRWYRGVWLVKHFRPVYVRAQLMAVYLSIGSGLNSEDILSRWKALTAPSGNRLREDIAGFCDR